MPAQGAQVEMVRVLDEDPDIGRYLSGRALTLASSAAVAPLLRVAPGPTSFLIDESATHAHLGLLMLDGLIVRHLIFGQIGANDFLGPGDLLRPWLSRGDSSEVVHVTWEALGPTRLAALDQDFANRTRAWPEIATALLDRAAERSDSQALQAALHQTRRVEDRVLLALWHFAGRWGQVGPEGRIVSLRNITRELLARFVGARRQSVSTAIGNLMATGAIRRLPDGSLVLPREPPQLEHIAPGRRATDRQPRLSEHG
ncbi:MAG TPA: Crp/Fnr family transcriptional regulator [Solirubrobacteraceae bacterium]